MACKPRKADKTLRCPFCAETPNRIAGVGVFETGPLAVICDCGATGPPGGSDYRKAIRRWNERPNLERMPLWPAGTHSAPRSKK